MKCLLAVMLVLVATTSANAQQVCGEHQKLIDRAHKQYKEVQSFIGVSDSNKLVEVLVSPTGTWTVLATGTDGESCVTLSGSGWEVHHYKTLQDGPL